MIKRLREFFTGPEPERPVAFIDPDSYPVQIQIAIGEMYREAKADLRETIRNGRDPNPNTDLGLYNIFRVARLLTPEDWELVRTKQELPGETNFGRRAEVLNLLRLWWTERHHISVGYQPMHLRLLADPGWED